MKITRGKRAVHLSQASDPNYFFAGEQPVTTVWARGRVVAQFYGTPVRNDGGSTAGLNLTTRTFTSLSPRDYDEGVQAWGT